MINSNEEYFEKIDSLIKNLNTLGLSSLSKKLDESKSISSSPTEIFYEVKEILLIILNESEKLNISVKTQIEELLDATTKALST